MLNACERRLLAFYLANAASSLHHCDREAEALAEWIADRENRTVFGSGRKRRRTHRTDSEDGVSARTLQRLEKDLRDEHSATRGTQSDRTARRLRCLANATGLNRTDLLILELLLRYRTQPIIESMVDDVFGPGGRHIGPLNLRGPALPMLLGVSANTVHRRLRSDAPLVRSGLVTIDSDGDLDIVARLHRRGFALRVCRLWCRSDGP